MRFLRAPCRVAGIVCLAVVALLGLGAAPGQAQPPAPEQAVKLHLPVVSFVEPPPEGGCALAPTLIAPADGAALTTLAPAFEWTPRPNTLTTGVRLEVATGADFANIVADATSGSPAFNHFTPWNNLERGQTYYWRAYSRCGDQPGDPSVVRSFTTPQDAALLGAPALVSPAAGATADMPIEVQWSAVEGAIRYNIWANLIESDDGFTSAVTTSGDATTTELLLSEAESGQVYEWWVQALGPQGYGPASEQRRVVVGATTE